MHWTIVLFLITLIIEGIVVYLLRNSHFSSYYGGESFKLPLIIWIALGIIALIPVLNIVGVIFILSLTIIAYCEEDVIFNDDFWLTKEY